MIATPTTTVSVLRGTTTTEFGDVVASGSAYLTGIPASLIERTRTGISQTDQSFRVYRYTVARLPYGTDVKDTDQIKDESTGAVYSIASVSVNANPVIQQDLRLDLQKTN
jgi:hypothetical protein